MPRLTNNPTASRRARRSPSVRPPLPARRLAPRVVLRIGIPALLADTRARTGDADLLVHEGARCERGEGHEDDSPSARHDCLG